MVEFGDLVAQGSNSARKAIALDNAGQYSAALSSYKESIHFLEESLASSKDETSSPKDDSAHESIRERIQGYHERCEAIMKSGLLPQTFRLVADNDNHIEFVDNEEDVELDGFEGRSGEITAGSRETYDLDQEIEDTKKRATLYTTVLAAAEGAEVDHTYRRGGGDECDDSIASSNSERTNNTNCAVHSMPLTGIAEEDKDPRMIAVQQQLRHQQRQIAALSTDLMVAVARNSAFEQKLSAGGLGEGDMRANGASANVNDKVVQTLKEKLHEATLQAQEDRQAKAGLEADLARSREESKELAKLVAVLQKRILALDSSTPEQVTNEATFPPFDGPALASLPEDEEEHTGDKEEWARHSRGKEGGETPSVEGLDADESALFLEQLQEKELLRESYSLAGKKDSIMKSPKRRANGTSSAINGVTTGSVLSESPSLRERMRSAEPQYLPVEQKESTVRRSPVYSVPKPRKTTTATVITSTERVRERPRTAPPARALKPRSKTSTPGIRDKETVRRSIKVVLPSGHKTSNSGGTVTRRRAASPQSVGLPAKVKATRTKSGSALKAQHSHPGVSVSVSLPSEPQPGDEDSDDRLGDLSLDSNNDGGFMNALEAIQGQEQCAGKQTGVWEAGPPPSEAQTQPQTTRKRISSKPSVPRARIPKKK